MSKKGILVLLILVLLLDITFIALNENSSRIYTKSLLVPLLIGFYLKGILNQNSENPIKLNFPFLIGLIFCLIGDLLLLNSGLFDLGLITFLLAHVFYIIALSKQKLSKPQNWVINLSIAAYLLAFLFFMLPHLSDILKIEVSIYGFVISVLLYIATRTENKNLIFGALFFIISDSILAIDTFVYQALFLKILIIITYVVAQYFLVQGMLNPKKPESQIETA